MISILKYFHFFLTVQMYFLRKNKVNNLKKKVNNFIIICYLYIYNITYSYNL